MEKTSKTFGRRFVAVVCALAMLVTLCPQGAFAAAPEPEPRPVGQPQTQEAHAPQEPTPMPAENTPAPQELTPAPAESTPASEPYLDGGDGILLTSLEPETLQLEDAVIKVEPNESVTDKRITLTAVATGDTAGLSYDWEITSGDGEVVSWDGGEPSGETATLKALKPGQASVKVTCDGQEDSCTVTIIQRYNVRTVAYSGPWQIPYGTPAFELGNVETEPADIGITAKADPGKLSVRKDVSLPITYDKPGASAYYELANPGDAPRFEPKVEITAKEINLAGITFVDKTYDGSAEISAIYTYGSGDIVSGDKDPSILTGIKYNADDADVGNDKHVSAVKEGDIVLDDSNYTLKNAEAIDSLIAAETVSITAKTVTLEVAGELSKESDGTAGMPAQPDFEEQTKAFTYTVDGAVDGETLTVSGVTAAAREVWQFENSDAGNWGITGIKPEHFTLAVDPGRSAGNYKITGDVDVDKLIGEISPRRSHQASLDAAHGAASVELVESETPVTFQQGAAKTDGTYWFNATTHKLALSPDNKAPVELYSSPDAGRYALFDAGTAMTTNGSGQELQLYFKNTDDKIFYGPVTVSYNYDATAPTITLDSVTGNDDLQFGQNGSLTYTVTVTDNESGIKEDSILYGVVEGENDFASVTAEDVKEWKNTPKPEPNGAGGYTVTVTAPAKGYLYVKVSDYAGHETTSAEMRPLVVEKVAPQVTIGFDAGSAADDPTREKTLTWSADDTKNADGGAAVTEYAGIDTVTLALLDAENGDAEVKEAADQLESGNIDNKAPTTLAGIEDAAVKTPTGSITVNGLSGRFKLQITATDFCGNKTVQKSAPFTLDNTKPTVSVEMKDGKENGGTWYYRADNCGLTVTVQDDFLAPSVSTSGKDKTLTVTLTDSNKAFVTEAALVEGNRSLTTSDLAGTTVAITKTQAVMTFPKTALRDPSDADAGLADGSIKVTVKVTDRAENETAVIQDTDEATDDHSAGVTVSAVSGDKNDAAFTLDTVAPVVTSVTFTDEDALYHDVERDNYYSCDTSVSLTFAVEEENEPAAWDHGYSYTRVEAPTDVLSKTGTGKTVTVEDEADYYDFYIEGADLAGNLLTTDTDDAVDDKNGRITVKAGMIVDRTEPEATISYESDGTPCFYPEEDGRSDGGAVYYNKPITANIHIEDGHKLDYQLVQAASGKTSETALRGTEIGARDDATNTNAFDWKASFGDGGDHPDEDRYHVTVYGTDRAGNPLTVTEEKTADDTAEITTDGCETDYTSKYTLVFDKTPPTAVMTLMPDAETENTELWENRYYFNKDFSIKLTVADTNPDPQKIDYEYGEAKGASNFADVNVQPSIPVDKSKFQDEGPGTPITASCDSNGDGAYIYRVKGADKAGNELILSPEPAGVADNGISIEKDDSPFTSYVIVVDTTPPKATVTMGNFYRATLDGASYTPSLNMPYQNTDRATVTFTPEDPSPTQIEYHIASTLGDKEHGADGSFTSNEPLYAYMEGEQKFNLTKLTVTDRAGNVSDMREETNHIYLDVEAPDIDELAPTVQLVTKHNGMGRGPDGVDLYDGTVTVQALVRDPDATERVSGLYEVRYEIRVNGDDWTDRVGVEPSASKSEKVRAGSIGYQTGGPGFDEGGDAHDEPITKEDEITFTFPADTFNYNDVYIYVWAQDNSGNELTKANAASYHFGIDVTTPTIQVSYDNNDVLNEKYFKADRTATVVITERNFDPNRTEIRTESQAAVGAWAYAAGTAANGDNDTWTCKVVYSVDGDYTFDVATTDQVGHTAAAADYGASVAPQAFTIDKTKPVITVTFDNNDERNGRYYNAARTATILVEEHNFDAAGATVETTADIQEGSVAAPAAGRWSSSGDDNTAAVAFLEDGDYTMDVQYTDLAGNEAEPKHIELFTVDTTAPTLEIGGVEDHVAYNGEVAPSITYHDINYDNTSARVTITGYRHPDGENLQGTRADDAFGGSLVCDNIPAVRENDDVYTATGFVSDLAGNVSEATIVFSVNRYGSTYVLGERTRALVDGYYTNQPQELYVTEINVSELVAQNVSVSLNGSLTNLNANSDYTVRQTNPGWMQYDYTISAANFNTEGAYTVTLYSEDGAANTNTNQAIRENNGATNTLPIEFLVDMTAPVTLITGVEDNERYVDTERTLMVDYGDNTALAGLSMYIGSDRVADYSAEELREAGGRLEYVARAANDWQTLRVTAVDVAGNSSEVMSGRFLLTDNLWVQYINNTPLLIGSICGVGALALLIILLLKRRKKEEE